MSSSTLASATAEVRVAVVDDLRMFAEPLALALNAREGMRCVGIAADFDHLMELMSEADRPDVVLMDARLPGTDTIESAEHLKERCPSTLILIMTGYPSLDLLRRAVSAGVDGFLGEAVSLDDTVSAIQSVSSDGSMVVDRATLSSLIPRLEAVPGRPTGADLGGGPTLTDREFEVLQFLGRGVDPKSIAEELGLSVHTVRSYVRTILQKFHAHSQLEAVVAAVRFGLLRELVTDRSLTGIAS